MRILALLLAMLLCLPVLAKDTPKVVKGCGKRVPGSRGEPAATYVGPPGCSQITALKIPPGVEVSWLPGRVPPFAAVVGGAVEVTLADGSKHMRTGKVALTEVMHWRKVRNPGNKPVRLQLLLSPYIDVVPKQRKAH